MYQTALIIHDEKTNFSLSLRQKIKGLKSGHEDFMNTQTSFFPFRKALTALFSLVLVGPLC